MLSDLQHSFPWLGVSVHTQGSYDFSLVPQLRNTFYDVESGPLGLGSKQFNCPNTPLEEKVLSTRMGIPLLVLVYVHLNAYWTFRS